MQLQADSILVAGHCRFKTWVLDPLCRELKAIKGSVLKAWSRSEYSFACFAHNQVILPVSNSAFSDRSTSLFLQSYLNIKYCKVQYKGNESINKPVRFIGDALIYTLAMKTKYELRTHYIFSPNNLNKF